MDVPETITCVECGAAAGRLTPLPPEEGLFPGDVVAYVCPECGQRFDIVLEDEAGFGD
jgi:Zn finger protein HypA/HybF involved in hydrogenase expression